MPRLLPSYLNTLRMQCGLSQPELADLLGISPSLLSKVESLRRRPTAKVILAAEVVFGLPAREIFPGACNDIEIGVAKRATTLRHQLKHRSDPAAADKLHLLGEIMKRTGRTNKDV